MNDTPRLVTLYLYLTAGCNLSCKHCWLNPPFDPDGTRHATMSFETICTAVAEARPLGLKSIKLTGGEALLHPRILDIIEFARTEQLGLIVETNGLLVTDAVVDALKAHGSVFVSVSLDSHRPEVHDAFRGVKGAFERTVAGIRKLAVAGLSPQVIASLIPQNRADMPEIVRLAASLGAGSFKMNIVQPTTRGALMQKRGDSVSLPEILEVCNDLFDRVGPETGMRVHPDLPHAFRALGSLHRNGGGHCTVKHIMGVLATGEYALCGIGTSMKELVFGRAGQDPLADIWATHPMLLALRNDLPARLEGICGRCVMRHQCLGSCVAQNFYRARSLTAPFWFCEAAEEMGLFPATRKTPEEQAVPVS